MFEFLDWVLGKALGVVGVFILAILSLFGFVYVLELMKRLNTPTFPWGVVAFFCIFVLPWIIYCITIICDKTLTKAQKKAKLWGRPY